MLGIALSACLGETCRASLDELVDAFGRVLGGGEERGKLRGRMAVAPELLEPLVSFCRRPAGPRESESETHHEVASVRVEALERLDDLVGQVVDRRRRAVALAVERLVPLLLEEAARDLLRRLAVSSSLLALDAPVGLLEATVGERRLVAGGPGLGEDCGRALSQSSSSAVTRRLEGRTREKEGHAGDAQDAPGDEEGSAGSARSGRGQRGPLERAEGTARAHGDVGVKSPRPQEEKYTNENQMPIQKLQPSSVTE